MVTVTTSKEQRKAADAARRAGGYSELVKLASRREKTAE